MKATRLARRIGAAVAKQALHRLEQAGTFTWGFTAGAAFVSYLLLAHGNHC